MKRRVILVLAVAGLLLAAQPAPSLGSPPNPVPPNPVGPHSAGPPAAAQGLIGAGDPSAGFVVRRGDQLLLDGQRFRFAGTNNYYLMN